MGPGPSAIPGIKTLTGLTTLSARIVLFCFACRHFWLPSVQETQLLAFEIGKRPCRKMEVSASMLEQSSILMPWWHGGVLITIHLYSRQWTKGTKNRKYMKTVADVLLCTATQNIAQRGHRESEDSGNKGNFLAILEVIAKHDPLIKPKMGHSNAKNTSNHIRNEILEVLADTVRKDIIEEEKESGVFSIVAYERKDLKKPEQISISTRVLLQRYSA